MWFIQMVFLSTWFFSAYKIVVKINVDVCCVFEFNVDTYVGSIIPRPLSYEQVVNALQWELCSNSVDQLWIKITQFASNISDGKEIVCFSCIYIIVHKKNMTTQLRLETRINWHNNGSICIIDPDPDKIRDQNQLTL